MSKEKNLNKNVADFEYRGRKYEVDLLLDTLKDGFACYDIFEMAGDKTEEFVAQLYLEQQEENDYMPSELIAMAKEELDKED